jgi:HlyD family secretion protein
MARATSRGTALAAAVAALAGCAAPGPRGAEDRSAVVARRTVEDVFLLTGELQAVRSDELTVPRLEGGRVQVKWVAEDGAEVEAGATVAELDNTQVAQSLEEKRLRLTQAQISLEQREASLEAEGSQKRLEREKAEIEAEKARIEAAVPQELRSRKEWHEKQQLLLRAEAALQKARSALATFEESSGSDIGVMRIGRDKAAREVQAAEASLKQLALVAPRRGIVIVGRSPMEDRPLQVGDNMWPGFRVVSIPDLSAMEILAYLPEVDDGRVVKGQDARVVLEADLDRCFKGRVEEVAAVAQDARFLGGFKVRISLEETDANVMRPGLSARVEVVRRKFENALVVPREAVTRGAKGYTARRPGGSAPLDVRVAACLPRECVIEQGLDEGSRVALP